MSSTVPVVWCADSSGDGGNKPAAFALHGIQLEGNITEKHVAVVKNLVAAATEGRLILPTDSALVLLDYGLSVESRVVDDRTKKEEENLCCAKCCSRKGIQLNSKEVKERRKSSEEQQSSCSSRKTSFDSLCTVSSSDSGFIEADKEKVAKRKEIVQQSHNRRKSLEEFRAILSELEPEASSSKAMVKSAPNSRKKKEDDEKKLIFTKKLTIYDKLISYGTIYDITLRKNEIYNKTYKKYDKYMTYGTIYEILRRHSLESYNSFMRKRRKSKTIAAHKSLAPVSTVNTIDGSSCGTIYDILQSLKQDSLPVKPSGRFSVEKVPEKRLEDTETSTKAPQRRFSNVQRPKIPEIWNIFSQEESTQAPSEELYSRIHRNLQIYKSNSLDILAGGEDEAGKESAIKFSVNSQLKKRSLGKSNTRRLSEFTRGEFLNEKL
ncbi:uncharacterized protein LOC132261317 [Phlebotomus argentipes]|uniref:uncharacterized protein LOC132261317 n=1 Tax=Phlebotomus argentipes TaxID=94469 RepID=UPI0028937708|nr:uncharacterized protein LOC132261317 [Phlebotomus argentipes]